MLIAIYNGQVEKDAEVKVSQSGKEYCSLELVSKKKGFDGKEHKTWLKATAFGHMVKQLAAVKAGTTIALTGDLQISTQKGQDGQARTYTSIIVSHLDVVGDAPRPAPQQTKTTTRAYNQGGGNFNEFDEGIPF